MLRESPLSPFAIDQRMNWLTTGLLPLSVLSTVAVMVTVVPQSTARLGPLSFTR